MTEDYAFRLGFESGFVEALPRPPDEYLLATDPYSRGYVAGQASSGIGVSDDLLRARAISIQAQVAAQDLERKTYRRAWRIDA